MKRTGADPEVIGDVIAGCVIQASEQALNIGRSAVLAAGWPENIPATTIDRQCGSSQQAAHFAAQAVIAGAQDVVVACGVEVMSRVPMGTSPMGRDTGGLSPSFRTEEMEVRFPALDWSITPGNSSPLTDGASAALIMSSEKVRELGLKPRARFHSFSVVGSDPIYMLTGPIPATETVLKRAGLSIADIDAFEVNEAFAPVPLAWAAETGADLAKLNPRGGAIALGHPLGASGTRLLTTLVNHLEQTGGKYGLQTMCEGAGMANATIIEML